MESMDHQDGGAFITEANTGYGHPDNTFSEQDGQNDIESDEEDQSNKIFNVEDAVPPTDYEAPYS